MSISPFRRKIFFKQKTLTQARFCSADLIYEMPTKYRDAFYLANASLFDNINWFVHRAYEVFFPTLFFELKEIVPSFSSIQISNKVKNIIYNLEPASAVVDMCFPVQKDHYLELVRGFRAQHGLYHTKLPSLGGLRVGADVDRNQIKALAVMATYQNACVGIPMAGSHGGIKIFRSDFNENEIKRVLCSYVKELIRRNFCGEFIDVIHIDKNVHPTEMLSLLELQDKELDSCIAGRSGIFGTSENYVKAATKSIFYAINFVLHNQTLMDRIEMPKGWSNKTFIIEGLGKIGSQVATFMEDAGAKCVGVKEKNCTLYDPRGISVQKISAHKLKYKSILNFSPLIKPFANNEVLKEECDLLVLAATDRTMSCYIADNVKAKIIVEAAKAPITPSAHKIFTISNKIVIPDIIANSGTAIVSSIEYFQQVQAEKRVIAMNTYTSFETNIDYDIPPVYSLAISPKHEHGWFAHIESVIEDTLKEALKITQMYDLGLDIRTAAYIRAIHNIFHTIFYLRKY